MSNTNTNLQTQTSNALHNAIMEAGGKDRPPMLAPGNYNPPYKFKWTEKTVPVAEGSSETTTEGYMENYKNVSQDIRNQLDAEAEAVQIILTGIDNDIYSTVDACPNACEMWKAIERLKQGESINVQDLETNLYWEFGKFTSRDGESLESYYSRFYKMMNELVRNQCDVTNHQVNVQFLLQLQPEWQRFVTLVKQSQELKTVSYHKLYDILKQHQNEVNEMRDEKEIDKLMAFISLSFKKIYKPTNNNLRTSSNTSRANQDNTPRINREDWGKDSRGLLHMLQTILTQSLILSGKRERDLLASLIEKLKCKIDDSKNYNKFLESSNKTLVDKLKDLKKFQAKLDRYHDVTYLSKVEIDCAKAKGCYNNNLALMLAPESDEAIRLAQESLSKLRVLIAVDGGNGTEADRNKQGRLFVSV
ncbi:hypothetical protein Tco_0309474 [Tanacetum coccineum]